MRVLWFSVTPSLFIPFNNGHNGGGWISSLETIVRQIKDIELGVAFEYPMNTFVEKQTGVKYYPLNVWTSFKRKLKRSFYVSAEEEFLIPACMKVIKDFHPDVIHVFGSENCFGLLSNYTNIPLIIHFQGFLPSYYNARFPQGINIKDIMLSGKYGLKQKFFEFKGSKIFKQRAIREEHIIRCTKFFFGRTHWDQSIIRLLNPNAKYYYCSEVLRDSFYKDKSHEYRFTGKLKLISVISRPLFKGMDMVLKTARLLKEEGKLDFEWSIIGLSESAFLEHHTGVKATDVNVIYEGILSANRVEEMLMNSDLYIHPSYIDNSPNSICEAQIQGIPVLACNVGGVSSLVEENLTGFLVPANDPYKMTDVILQLAANRERLLVIGNKACQIAKRRHSKEEIARNLISAYKEITNTQ